MKTSVLGLGIIGEAWARNLNEDGLLQAAWNRTPKEVPNFVSDAKAAIRDAELIILVVADPPAVEEVLNQIESSLHKGQILAQSSTVSAVWTRKFAERVEKTGARFLEAPFTGSKPAAAARKNVFYMGGDPELMKRTAPVFSRLGTSLHIGPIGSASSLKLAMNMNIAMLLEGLQESLTFARAEGVSDESFFNALKINTAHSPMCDLKEPKLRNKDYSPQFSLKHMNKDLRLALESADALSMPQLRKVKEQYDEGMRRGLGEQDFSVLMSLL
jgi:3-hydroxyisobutyrate dehydrogenase-like beta-hydroxyacid dehydrogenase